MPHDAVRTGLHELVILLNLDLRTPVAADVKPRPHRECESHNCKREPAINRRRRHRYEARRKRRAPKSMTKQNEPRDGHEPYQHARQAFRPGMNRLFGCAPGDGPKHKDGHPEIKGDLMDYL